MIITPETLKALFTGFKKNFQDGLQMADSQYAQIATVIPSSTASNTYGWLGQWPAFREWVGDRVVHALKAGQYSITNKEFEATVEVKRADVDDDNLGVYAKLRERMPKARIATVRIVPVDDLATADIEKWGKTADWVVFVTAP